MSLDKMFSDYPENLIGFRRNKGVNIMDFWLNPKWSILDDSINEGVQIKKQKVSEETGMDYYIMYSQEHSLENLYKTLVEVIEYNIDLEKKQQLFTEKVTELKDIFSSLDYESLSSLSFDTQSLGVTDSPNDIEDVVEEPNEDDSVEDKNDTEENDTEENDIEENSVEENNVEENNVEEGRWDGNIRPKDITNIKEEDNVKLGA